MVPADADFRANATEPQMADPAVVKLGLIAPALGCT